MSTESEILKEGVADLKFGIWLETNFGFYTMGVLVNADWDSNVLYQYNAETQVFQSSYDEINMIHIHSYSIEKRPWGLYLNLYGEDEGCKNANITADAVAGITLTFTYA